MSFTSFYFDPFAEFNRSFDDSHSQQGRHGGPHQHGGRHGHRDPWQGGGGGRGGDSHPGAFKPTMDVHESNEDNKVTVIFDLPGLKKEDVNIDVHNNRLVVSGESKSSAERNEDGYALRERRYGKFSRTVPLPVDIQTQNIKATMEDGVLTVTFPKSGPEHAPERITIS